jgi:hypothetical protein
MTDTNDALPLEGLNKKVDAVIDHCASNFGVSDERIGKLEAKAEYDSKALDLLSTDFQLSHDGLGAQFKSLETLVNQLNERISVEPQWHLDISSKASIYGALAKAQQEIVNADANIDNAFLKTKYADLGSCLNAVRGPLSSNGIALIQLTEDQSQSVLGIRTILAHESGETIEDLITMSPPKMDPQGIGSCRTYMRRYSLMAICGIAGALDDDAEATKKDPNDYPRIETSEVEKIIYHADELFGDNADDAVKLMLDRIFGKIAVIGDIRAGEMQTALNYLDNAKKARDKKIAAAKKAEEAEAKAAKAEK